jgi:hypothetical protein
MREVARPCRLLSAQRELICSILPGRQHGSVVKLLACAGVLIAQIGSQWVLKTLPGLGSGFPAGGAWSFSGLPSHGLSVWRWVFLIRLLAGIVFWGLFAHAMSPTHTRKNGRLYRYNLSQTVLKRGAGECPVARVPAARSKRS